MQVNSQVVISAISMMNKLIVSSQLPWQWKVNKNNYKAFIITTKATANGSLMEKNEIDRERTEVYLQGGNKKGKLEQQIKKTQII